MKWSVECLHWYPLVVDFVYGQYHFIPCVQPGGSKCYCISDLLTFKSAICTVEWLGLYVHNLFIVLKGSGEDIAFGELLYIFVSSFENVLVDPSPPDKY